MKKRIVLCADDYGQAEAVSKGILALVKEQRLSAVSCMVTAPYFKEHAKWLQEFKDQIDIGLHFNLTENRASLLSIILKTQLRQLKQKDMVRELNQQIDAFSDAFGLMPMFIDGHQHVHQFPVVRDALLHVYDSRLKPNQPYIRLSKSNMTRGDYRGNIKKMILNALGTNQLKQLLDKEKIPYNQSFAGMYAFDQAKNFDQIFKSVLADISDRGLIMCHPGLPSQDVLDPISAARGHEYHYFKSPQFLADCERFNVVISRFEKR